MGGATWGKRHPERKHWGFQSTLPVGGATPIRPVLRQPFRYFNPRSPWGERPFAAEEIRAYVYISIHAPRGGSDLPQLLDSCPLFNFNPRSPWEERPIKINSLIRFPKVSSFTTDHTNRKIIRIAANPIPARIAREVHSAFTMQQMEQPAITRSNTQSHKWKCW